MGAHVLDVNMGVPLTDEADLLARAITARAGAHRPADLHRLVASSRRSRPGSPRTRARRSSTRSPASASGSSACCRSSSSTARRSSASSTTRRASRRRPTNGSRSASASSRSSTGVRDPARGHGHRPARDDGRSRPAGRGDDARDDQPDSRRVRPQHDARRLERLLRAAQPARAERGVPRGRLACRPHERDHGRPHRGNASTPAARRTCSSAATSGATNWIAATDRHRRSRRRREERPPVDQGRAPGGHRGRRPRPRRAGFVPSGTSVRVPPGVTVFDAASWNGIAIDSTCGGHGTCKKCRVRIADGRGAGHGARHARVRRGRARTGLAPGLPRRRPTATSSSTSRRSSRGRRRQRSGSDGR